MVHPVAKKKGTPFEQKKGTPLTRALTTIGHSAGKAMNPRAQRAYGSVVDGFPMGRHHRLEAVGDDVLWLSDE